MWKLDIANNTNLNSHKSAKKGHKPGRGLRMETLETRTMFYADPLTLSMPDTPVLVGEPQPAGPLPEYFLQKQGPTSQINPSQIDRDEPQNTPVTIDPYANDVNLFPLGRPTPPNRYVPTPIGVFPDGSVRTVHPEIDPIVVEYMDNHGTGPIRDFLHRPADCVWHFRYLRINRRCIDRHSRSRKHSGVAGSNDDNANPPQP